MIIFTIPTTCVRQPTTFLEIGKVVCITVFSINPDIFSSLQLTLYVGVFPLALDIEILFKTMCTYQPVMLS